MPELLQSNSGPKTICYVTNEPNPRTITRYDFRNGPTSFVFNPDRDPNIYINKADIHPTSVPGWKRSNSFEDEYYKGYVVDLIDSVIKKHSYNGVANKDDSSINERARDRLLKPFSSMGERSQHNIKIHHLGVSLARIDLTTELPEEIQAAINSFVEIVNTGYDKKISFALHKFGFLKMTKDWESIDYKTEYLIENENYFGLFKLKDINSSKTLNLLIADTEAQSSTLRVRKLGRSMKDMVNLINI